MKKTIIFLFLLLLCPIMDLKAQFYMEGQLDLGTSQVSDGLYAQISHTGFFEKLRWGAQAGYQLGIIQPQDVFFNSWYGSSYGKLPLGKIQLILGGEYLWTAISPDLRETNWILFARTTFSHWQLGLGNNTRVYRLSNKAAKNDGVIDPDDKIIEAGNLMYNIRYILKHYENRWNLMATLTNYDRFLIEQETNPMINIRFDYKLSEPLTLYSELWYKSAGLLNARVNYFGTFIRIGVIWEPGRKQG
jgi:hypothetical protein